MSQPRKPTQPLTRRERRERERRAAKTTTIRPAVQGDFGSYPIPVGSMVIVRELAPGIRHKVLIEPEGGSQ